MSINTQTMPPEVAEAIDYMDRCGVAHAAQGGWSIIRAHLHRLAEENAELHAAIEVAEPVLRGRAERAESELAAIKKRIAEAPKTTAYADGDDGLTIGCGPHILACMDESEIGECFAIVKLEDGE